MEVSVYTNVMHQARNKSGMCPKKRHRPSKPFSECVLYSCAANPKASSENRKADSKARKATKGFFQRELVSYTHMFLKCCAASLMHLLELRL